jgi:Tfp pilus assembly protein PilN
MVQVIPRVSKKNKTRLNVILPWFSLILVFIVVFGVFFFSARINANNSKIGELDEQLAAAKSEEEEEIEKTLMVYKKKVNNVIDILKERERSLEFYSFLEGLVHPDIYFTDLSLDMEQGFASLTGIVKDFESLGQQISAFKENDYIYDAQAETISLDKEEGIGFTIQLTIFEPKEEE